MAPVFSTTTAWFQSLRQHPVQTISNFFAICFWGAGIVSSFVALFDTLGGTPHDRRRYRTMPAPPDHRAPTRIAHDTAEEVSCILVAIVAMWLEIFWAYKYRPMVSFIENMLTNLFLCLLYSVSVLYLLDPAATPFHEYSDVWIRMGVGLAIVHLLSSATQPGKISNPDALPLLA